MALNFDTATPNKLLAAFKKAIDDGHVDTWSYNAAGDFTHIPPQWKGEALMRPEVFAGRLTFSFLRKRTEKTSRELYAVYHGRLAESFLVHCDQLFDNVSATALATNSDRLVAVA
jgi:hypothetical protein